MKATRHGEEELFDAARELPEPAARKAFLDRACDGDLALRVRIEELLAAELTGIRRRDKGVAPLR